MPKYVFLGCLLFNWFVIGWYLTDASELKTQENEMNPASHQEVLNGWTPTSDVTESVNPNISTNDISSSHSFLNEIPQEQLTDTHILDVSNTPSSIPLDTPYSTTPQQATHPVFEVTDLSSELIHELNQFANLDESVISYHQLKLVTVTHWGFDGQQYLGELIVHHEVANEVKEIFMEVYESHYPIEKMILIHHYQNNDNASMLDNNTSAFNYRPITNGSNLSAHAYGLAIDINPAFNPFVNQNYILPTNAVDYVNRELHQVGMIQPGDALYTAFTSRGWSWGGDWTELKDYQHFSKRID